MYSPKTSRKSLQTDICPILISEIVRSTSKSDSDVRLQGAQPNENRANFWLTAHIFPNTILAHWFHLVFSTWYFSSHNSNPGSRLPHKVIKNDPCAQHEPNKDRLKLPDVSESCYGRHSCLWLNPKVDKQHKIVTTGTYWSAATMYDLWDDNLKKVWGSFTSTAAIDNWVFRLHYMATYESKENAELC